MNYKRIYESIIKNAKLENRKRKQERYYENHHILPKSLGGLDEDNNLVLLTAKEHFICHKLLKEIYPGRKMSYALWIMVIMKNKHISAREYDRLKNEISKIGWSDEAKQKLSDSKKGRKPSLETRRKMSIAQSTRKRKPFTDEAKENMRKAQLGKKLSMETRKKMSAAKKGKHVTKETIEKIKISKAKKSSEERSNAISKGWKTRREKYGNNGRL
jgi:hypothetical protein